MTNSSRVTARRSLVDIFLVVIVGIDQAAGAATCAYIRRALRYSQMLAHDNGGASYISMTRSLLLQ